MSSHEAPTTQLSVRAEARRTVEPDRAQVSTQLMVTGATKRAALDGVGAALQAVTDALGGLGGMPLSAEQAQGPLLWQAHSLHTWSDRDYDERGRPSARPTHRAAVELRILVRDFTLLPAVEQVLTAHDQVSINNVMWSADVDNPAWALVRADAIAAALRKGQDYAAALGGEVLAVEQIADAGLLGAAGAEPGGWRMNAEVQAAGMSSSGDGQALSLDPVPQTLTATIDARLAATTGPLPTR